MYVRACAYLRAYVYTWSGHRAQMETGRTTDGTAVSETHLFLNKARNSARDSVSWLQFNPLHSAFENIIQYVLKSNSIKKIYLAKWDLYKNQLYSVSFNNSFFVPLLSKDSDNISKFVIFFCLCKFLMPLSHKSVSTFDCNNFIYPTMPKMVGIIACPSAFTYMIYSVITKYLSHKFRQS